MTQTQYYDMINFFESELSEALRQIEILEARMQRHEEALAEHRKDMAWFSYADELNGLQNTMLLHRNWYGKMQTLNKALQEAKKHKPE